MRQERKDKKKRRQDKGFGVALHEPCPHRAAKDDMNEREQRKEEWKGKQNKKRSGLCWLDCEQSPCRVFSKVAQ